MALPIADGGGSSTSRRPEYNSQVPKQASKPKRKPSQPPAPKITPSPTGQVQVTAPPKETAGPIATVQKPKPISKSAYLAGDTAYNDYLIQAKKQLADLKAQQFAQKNQQAIDYDTQRDMLTQNQEKSFADLLEDYSSRGLAQSGLYADAYSDLNTNWQNQFNALDTQNKDFYGGLDQALLDAQNQYTTGKNSAKQAALERYAQQLLGGK